MQDGYNLVMDRAKRIIKPPESFDYVDLISYALLISESSDDTEPWSNKEAFQRKDRNHWMNAMTEEISSLERNKTWVLVQKPQNQKLVGCILVFKKKEVIPGVEEPRFKTRLVAKGFNRKEELTLMKFFVLL